MKLSKTRLLQSADVFLSRYRSNPPDALSEFIYYLDGLREGSVDTAAFSEDDWEDVFDRFGLDDDERLMALDTITQYI